MNLPQISSYEIKTSRTEQKVPVVNGVHLHSIYNPFKEAETLIDNHIEVLKNKNEVLILGLGFAYHVNYIIEKLTEFHGSNFKIVVIEPSIQVHQDCLEFGLLNKKNVLIYSAFTSNELYSDIELVNFLLRKPAMIAHPPSFNLYQYYFKTFLTFEAPIQIEEIIKFTEVQKVKKYLQSLDGKMSFEDAVYQGLPLKKSFTSMDFLAMAMVEMTKGSIEKSSGESES